VDRCQRSARGTNPEEREEGEGWAVGGGALAGRSIKTGDGDRDPMGHSVSGTAGAPGPVIDKVGFEGVTLHWGIAGNRSAPGGPHPLCFPGNTTRSWVPGGGGLHVRHPLEPRNPRLRFCSRSCLIFHRSLVAPGDIQPRVVEWAWMKLIPDFRNRRWVLNASA